MPVSRHPIPHRVYTRHNFQQEYSNRSKIRFVGREIAYVLICFFYYYLIRYGDTVEQTRCTFSRSIHANKLRHGGGGGGGGGYIIGVNRAGKSARSLFNCISVTDDIKIIQQNKSIGIGPLYL